MPRPPTLLVMAAGLGSRFGGLKQVAGVGPNGETIVDYAILDALRAGFGKVVFVIRESIEADFVEKYGRWSDQADTAYVFQELDMLPAGHSVPQGREKPWGTGHAVLQARDAIDGPFAVINADDFYGRQAFELLHEHLSGDSVRDYCMVAYDLGKTLSPTGPVTRGICSVSAEGYLTGVRETAGVRRNRGGISYPGSDGTPVALDETEPTSMNMWGFTPGLFDHLEHGLERFLEASGGSLTGEYLLPNVITRLIEAGEERVRVLRSKEPCIGVTHREDQGRVADQVRSLIEAGLYPSTLPVDGDGGG